MGPRPLLWLYLAIPALIFASAGLVKIPGCTSALAIVAAFVVGAACAVGVCYRLVPLSMRPFVVQHVRTKLARR